MAQYNLPRNTQLVAPVRPPMVQASVPTPTDPSDPRGLTAFIQATAAKYGIDPNVALRVAKSEGLSSFQSGVFKNGVQEPSYGAFQLYTGGGLGNLFQKETGLDPSDPKNERATIDYALKQASQGGWGPWYGAKNTGIGQFEGIGTGSGGAGKTTDFYSGDPVPETDTARTTTPSEDAATKDEKKKDKKQKDYQDIAGDTVADLGKTFAEGPVAKNAAKASGPVNIPTVMTSAAQGPIPMMDAKRAEMQRQQLAYAMQRLNSGRLV
jgi:hypothetical protein